MNNSEKLQEFLNRKLSDCTELITKYKTQNRRLKILYYMLIISIIIGQTSVSIGAPLMVPASIIAGISGGTAILTAISTKFQLKNKRNKIDNKIQEVRKIKGYLEYVKTRNGDITDVELKDVIECLA